MLAASGDIKAVRAAGAAPALRPAVAATLVPPVATSAPGRQPPHAAPSAGSGPATVADRFFHAAATAAEAAVPAAVTAVRRDGAVASLSAAAATAPASSYLSPAVTLRPDVDGPPWYALPSTASHSSCIDMKTAKRPRAAPVSAAFAAANHPPAAALPATYLAGTIVSGLTCRDAVNAGPPPPAAPVYSSSSSFAGGAAPAAALYPSAAGPAAIFSSAAACTSAPARAGGHAFLSTHLFASPTASHRAVAAYGKKRATALSISRKTAMFKEAAAVGPVVATATTAPPPAAAAGLLLVPAAAEVKAPAPPAISAAQQPSVYPAAAAPGPAAAAVSALYPVVAASRSRRPRREVVPGAVVDGLPPHPLRRAWTAWQLLCFAEAPPGTSLLEQKYVNESLAMVRGYLQDTAGEEDEEGTDPSNGEDVEGEEERRKFESETISSLASSGSDVGSPRTRIRCSRGEARGDEGDKPQHRSSDSGTQKGGEHVAAATEKDTRRRREDKVKKKIKKRKQRKEALAVLSGPTFSRLVELTEREGGAMRHDILRWLADYRARLNRAFEDILGKLEGRLHAPPQPPCEPPGFAKVAAAAATAPLATGAGAAGGTAEGERGERLEESLDDVDAITVSDALKSLPPTSDFADLLVMERELQEIDKNIVKVKKRAHMHETLEAKLKQELRELNSELEKLREDEAAAREADTQSGEK